MSFQLQAFKAYGIRVSATEQRMHAKQRMLFQIAAANTDTALDLSAITAGALGTFWTAAVADAVYGNIANQALTTIRQIQLILVDTGILPTGVITNYVQVLSGAAGNQYTATIQTNLLPNIAWVSGSAPTAYFIELESLIHDGQEPITTAGDLGAQL